MATPTTRTTTPLAAGNAWTIRPSKVRRAKRLLADVATMPIVVTVAARPRLNATIRSRTTSAVGQGRIPARDAGRDEAPQVAFVLVRAVVVVMVVARRGGRGHGGD